MVLFAKEFSPGRPRIPYALPASFNPNRSWGEQLFKHYFGIAERVLSTFATLQGDARMRFLLTGKVRQIFFRLEALSKFYGDGDPFFDPLHDRFKEIEDLGGQVDLYNEMAGHAQSIGEPSLVQYFEKKRGESGARLFAALEDFPAKKFKARLASRSWRTADPGIDHGLAGRFHQKTAWANSKNEVR